VGVRAGQRGNSPRARGVLARNCGGSVDKRGPPRVYYGVRHEVPLSTNEKHDLQAAARGQLAAAYDRHGAALYRYALVVCARQGLAEDAVQQAFAKLAALGPRIEELRSPGDYLRVAVRNECYRLLQLPRLTTVDAESAAALLEPVEAGLELDEQRRAIESALASLPAEQREIVHLKVYEEQTFQQIADWLAIPLNTAASRYRYAIDKLRERLATMQKNESGT
jgi:RNA polymerase sigma-70 factor, ECF subfamily